MNRIIIPGKIFSQMQAYKPLDCSQNKRQQLKYTFMGRIKENVSVRWNRAKKLVRVIDEIIYKATDRGYSFNGRETLAEICEVGLSTVDKGIKVLKESGKVIVAYRENPNSNGYKTPIIILKDHPHFNYWNALLNLEQNVKQKVENTETTTESEVNPLKIVSTYSLPSKQDNNINKVVRYVSNRINDVIKRGSTIEYLSSYVNATIHDLEWKALYYENMRIEKERWKREEERSQLAVELGLVPKRVKLEDVYYNYYE